LEEMKKNRACIAEIDRILEPYSDRVKELDTFVDTEGLIRYFCLDSDDPDLLQKAVEAMWNRAGALEHAAVSAAKAGDFEEKAKMEAEVREIRRLVNDTNKRIKELNNKR
jgi:hypothetical protein